MNSTADDGAGTLRWALESAESGDTITFDPGIFPPDAPTTIYATHVLPGLTQGDVMIDASNAGVLLDGSHMLEGFAHGLEIYSDWNVVMGLQVVNFVGAGLAICSGSHNTIGGDRSIGAGPIGQGNVFSGNGMGTDLCDPGTSGNAFYGNLIGVLSDGTTPFGNRGSGIFIEPGVVGSQIGPGNIIAHNSVCAVEVFGAASIRNRITGNAIFGNERGGIVLVDSANGLPDAPTLIGVDLEGGLVSGLACPNCTVEVFSDRANQGEIFEGSAVADGQGAFSIRRTGQLAGPNVTATVTTPDGSTGPFSNPVVGTRSIAAIQQGASGWRSISVCTDCDERADQFTTGLWSGLWQAVAYQWDLGQILQDEALSMGPTGVRLAVNSLDLPSVNWQEPEWPFADPFINLASTWAQAGVAIRYGLSFWDKAGHAAGDPAPCERFSTQRDIDRYLDFVRAVVQHVKESVFSFELWNEPNVPDCWQHIPVEQYVELVRQVAPVIHELAPGAEIVIGSVTPFIDCGGYEYLLALVESDVLPLVGAISWHMGAPSPEYEEWRDICENYADLITTIMETARANGFEGRFIADELNWRSSANPHPYGGEPWTYTPVTAAKYYARGTLMNLGLGVDVGFAELSTEREPTFSVVRNLCRALRGVEPIPFAAQVEAAAETIVQYGFVLPGGERVFAFWMEGVALDEESGIPATITFPGLSAGAVTGIDVLHGLEQGLVFDADGSSVIVRDVLIKDYPILIRLNAVTTGSD